MAINIGGTLAGIIGMLLSDNNQVHPFDWKIRVTLVQPRPCIGSELWVFLDFLLYFLDFYRFI